MHSEKSALILNDWVGACQEFMIWQPDIVYSQMATLKNLIDIHSWL